MLLYRNPKMILLKNPLMHCNLGNSHISGPWCCGLIDVNSRLAKQLEESAQALKEIRVMLKKDRNDRGTCKPFAPSLDNYC
jgi:hypothetical protein